jgi:hypothetical protein
MDKPGFTPKLRTTLFSAITGKSAYVSGKPEGDVAGMLMAVGGPSDRTRSGIDTAAAAKALGVSRRTVERWLTGATERNRPSGKNLQKLAAQARKAATTKRGRRAALADVRKGGMPRYGARIEVRGVQGPTRQGTDYRRFRRLSLTLDPEHVEAMLAAYEEGGDKGFVSWLEGHAEETYMGFPWGFDNIDTVELDEPRQPGQ